MPFIRTELARERAVMTPTPPDPPAASPAASQAVEIAQAVEGLAGLVEWGKKGPPTDPIPASGWKKFICNLETVLAALASAERASRELEKERNEAQRVLANVGATVDAITDIMNGKPVSDFMLSFPLVRAVGDLKGEHEISDIERGTIIKRALDAEAQLDTLRAEQDEALDADAVLRHTKLHLKRDLKELWSVNAFDWDSAPEPLKRETHAYTKRETDRILTALEQLKHTRAANAPAWDHPCLSEPSLLDAAPAAPSHSAGEIDAQAEADVEGHARDEGAANVAETPRARQLQQRARERD